MVFRLICPAMKEKTQNNQLLYPIFLVAFLIIYLYVFDSKLDLNGDNASYFILGKALADGLGYVSPVHPDMPPHSHFPIGYPLLIAGLMKLGIKSLVGIKIFNGVLLFATGIMSFQLYKKLVSSNNLAFIGSLAIFFNPVLMRQATIIMSEIPFLFFTTLGLFSYVKFIHSEMEPWYKRWSFYVMLFSLIYGFYLKTLGFVTIGAVGISMLVRKNWPQTITAGLVFLGGVGPSFFKSTGGGNYVGQLLAVNPYDRSLGTVGFSDLVDRAVENITKYGTNIIPSTVVPFVQESIKENTFLGGVVGLIILALIVIGIKSIKEKWLMTAFFLFTAFVLIFWPQVWSSSRFMIHLVPLFMFMTFFGLFIVVNKLTQKYFKKEWGVAAVVIVVLLGLPGMQFQNLRAESDYPPQFKQYFRVAEWCKKNTPQDALIIARKPNMFYLFADRHVLKHEFTRDDIVLMDDLVENGADYVVLESLGYGSTYKYLLPAIKKHSYAFPRVLNYQNPPTMLFQFNAQAYMQNRNNAVSGNGQNQ
jgi:4-amino-4-deoxy-L-arabinose transferase-like glycosyltransferase